MNIELIQDDEPNAYIYNEADLIDSASIFQRWFNCVYYLKKKYPKKKCKDETCKMCFK